MAYHELVHCETKQVTVLVHAFHENSAGWSFLEGSEDGAVVRALAFHQCGPGSIPRPGIICGLSLLLVLVLAPRVFLRVLRLFLPPQ